MALADLGSPDQYYGGSPTFNENLGSGELIPQSTQFDWGQFTGGVTGTGDPTAVTGGTGGSWNPSMVDAFGQAWLASGGRTVQDLQAFVAAHPEYGATLTGSKGDKVTFQNGRAFDAVIAAGEGGGRGASWGDITNGGGGSGSGGIGSGAFLTPWTQQFAAPSAQDALNSPGLQFAMQEAQKAAEASAASKGTLLTGGFQKALAAQQTGMALQGYNDVYNRAMGEYGLQRENFYNNQDRPFSKLTSLATIGGNAAAQTGNYGTSYANGGSNSLGNIGNANAAGSIAQGNIWGPYVNNFGGR